jgi:hypothetical protein
MLRRGYARDLPKLRLTYITTWTILPGMLLLGDQLQREDV